MKKITPKSILTGILVIALLSGAFMFSISSPTGLQPETDIVEIIRYVNSDQILRSGDLGCINEQSLSVNRCKNTVTSSQYGEIQLDYSNDFNLGIWSELGANLACDYTAVKFSVKNQKTGSYENVFSVNADDDEKKYYTSEPCTGNINLVGKREYDDKATKYTYSCINKSFTTDHITIENKVEVLIYLEGNTDLGVEDFYSCHPEIAIGLLNAPLDPNPPEESIIEDTIEIIEDIPNDIVEIIEDLIPPTQDEIQLDEPDVPMDEPTVPIDETIVEEPTEDFEETIIDDIDKTQIDEVSIIDDRVDDTIFTKMGRYLEDFYNFIKNLFK